MKRFKIMELGKLFARKKNGNKTLLKVDFWKLKNGKDEKTGRFEIVQKPKFPKKMYQSGFKKPSSSWEYAEVDPGRNDAWPRRGLHHLKRIFHIFPPTTSQLLLLNRKAF